MWLSSSLSPQSCNSNHLRFLILQKSNSKTSAPFFFPSQHFFFFFSFSFSFPFLFLLLPLLGLRTIFVATSLHPPPCPPIFPSIDWWLGMWVSFYPVQLSRKTRAFENSSPPASSCHLWSFLFFWLYLTPLPYTLNLRSENSQRTPEVVWNLVPFVKNLCQHRAANLQTSTNTPSLPGQCQNTFHSFP